MNILRIYASLGQGLSDDLQHIPPPLMVDGAWPWLPGDTGARLSTGPRWPSCHHCLRVPPWLPVHRGVEFCHSDPVGCTYPSRSWSLSRQWLSLSDSGLHYSYCLFLAALRLCVRLLRKQSLPGRRGQLWVPLLSSRLHLLVSHVQRGDVVSYAAWVMSNIITDDSLSALSLWEASEVSARIFHQSIASVCLSVCWLACAICVWVVLLLTIPVVTEWNHTSALLL